MSNVKKSTFRVRSITFKPLKSFINTCNLAQIITFIRRCAERNNWVFILKVKVTLKGQMLKVYFLCRSQQSGPVPKIKVTLIGQMLKNFVSAS